MEGKQGYGQGKGGQGLGKGKTCTMEANNLGKIKFRPQMSFEQWRIGVLSQNGNQGV
jgi:hypothetical protein